MSPKLLLPLFLLATPLQVLVPLQAAPKAKPAAKPSKPIQDPAQSLQAIEAPAGAIWLEQLNLKNMTQGWGEPEAGQSVGDNPMKIKGQTFPHGVGTHTPSRITVDLKRNARRFLAMAGVDDETGGQGAGLFRVFVDDEKKFEATIKGGESAKFVSVDLAGAETMKLEIVSPNNNESNGHVNWAGAMLVLTPQAIEEGEPAWPVSVPPPPLAHSKLPPFFADPPTPVIHPPRLLGASPSKPFLFLVPATGKAPLSYSAQNLPAGLKLDAKSGIISGRIQSAGDYNVRLEAKNALGSDSSVLKISCGEGKLALTPILAWNAWSVFGEDVTAAGVAKQADWLIESGLAAHGWQTIIVDDTWQSRRDADGTIGSNRRFGSMKALADYVHSKGLKIGLLSAATPQTCSGFAGSAGFEEQDAALYARWGIDFLKYDWCPENGNKNVSKPEEVRAGFKKMGDALKKVDRDIIFPIVPYGFGGRVQEWGAQTGAHIWRTTSGLLDSWNSLESVAFAQGGNDQFAGAGRWNDPGPLMVGRFTPRNPHFSNLTPDQQKLQVSMWTMMAAPMILSCDLSQLDPNHFYRLGSTLLMNDEVLEVHQDPLAKAGRVVSGGDIEVWSRPLTDGSTLVGVFNRRGWGQWRTVKWSDFGKSGKLKVRDLWGRRDVGTFNDELAIEVPAFGAMLWKVSAP